MPRRPDSPASALRAGEAHHGLPVHEVVLLLETDPDRGLAGDEAARRLDRFGPNTLPAAARGGPLLRALRQFHHPLIYILIAAGAVTAALGESVDSAVIFAVVLVNAFVGFAQESRAEAALDSLRSMVRTTAKVVRDGRERAVPSEEVVPGDLVLVEAGDKVPADVRLLRAVELRVDESALTGESVPVAKDEVLLDPLTPVADRRNTLHSGTLVTAGRGAGVAVATGAGTELGEIHRLVGAAEVLTTPLTEKLAGFSRVLTVVILVLAALTFAIGLARGQDASGTFTAAVALAVGTIPEGLPAVVTITLAIGVSRMARRRAVIRRLPAVETLGSITVICSDKTGTLTENQMTVRAVWTPDGEFSVSGSGYAPEGEFRRENGGVVSVTANRALYRCLLAGALCNDAVLTGGAAEPGGKGRWSLTGDPTEGALLAAAAKGGLVPDVTTVFSRVGTVPFSSERRYMATVHRDEATGGHLLLVKGAVEQVVELCSAGMEAGGGVRPLDREAVLRAAGELAGRGLRVLATAELPGVEPEGIGEGAPQDPMPDSMVFTGLQAMLDPPRAAAVDAVRACRTAGIGVKMITGDHAATATAVAGRIGLLTERREGEVLTGADLAVLSAQEYPDAVERARVFARVSPEQKLRLVEALQARGQVVAMTGDGVNDAPALRQANIGVAMGRGGTEVAKDAADMVLTDDDFATIESAVEEGRGVFDNLVKFIVWVLPTSLGQGMLVLVAILFGATLPVLPTQILWINMTTAVALGLMLAFEPKEEGIMLRRPRDPGRPLLTTGLALRVLLVSALIVGGAWWLFTWERAEGAGLAEARTAAVNLVVAVELFYLFSCRSLTRSMWSAGLFGNRWIIWGVLAQTAGQLAITYLPAMNRLFHTAPIDGRAWLRILGIALLASLVVAVDKRFRRQLV
ncbi:HAD-IC family P-type ATPase [Streptomyces sp. CNQ085]|uniref:HAD-IC family P-type ATPase n=1 Tax=Streptomyces sp. CNQ085 TaxID=2886944 RepID=UPI001F509EAF|nr:HAD-IC family P-type ATPase [Streptomyces sp. CNQ085]MCI0385049.1 HAD-IC family P-type ATPase [Streptomyces sp. CNQ085]